MERQQCPNGPAPPQVGRAHSPFSRSRSMSRKELEIILRIGCVLSAFACVAAHAQTCSGGADGGMDATGNQCNARVNDSSFGLPATLMTRPATASAAPTPVGATPTGIRAKGTQAPRPRGVAAGRPMNRFPDISQPPVRAVHAAKTENMQKTLCSGGMDGGMDATGNQCNPANSAANVVVARVRQR
jgi:hypothetical protein